ncbi:hypothetical protein As57867_006894, partial [Aphanomyces stellatus]
MVAAAPPPPHATDVWNALFDRMWPSLKEAGWFLSAYLEETLYLMPDVVDLESYHILKNVFVDKRGVVVKVLTDDDAGAAMDMVWTCLSDAKCVSTIAVRDTALYLVLHAVGTASATMMAFETKAEAIRSCLGMDTPMVSKEAPAAIAAMA